MTFFPHLERPKKIRSTPTPTAWDITSSLLLFNALKERVQKHSKKEWANNFWRLRKLDKHSKEKIEKVLQWYSLHFRETYTPKAYCSKSFRKKFLQIEDAMIRDVGKEVSITPEAKSISVRVLRVVWKKNTREQVMQAVQQSFTVYSAFYSRLYALIVNEKTPPRDVLLYTHLRSRLGAPPSFVENWFTQVYHSVKNWKEWSGDLQRMSFTPESKVFKRMGRTITSKYCGDASRWDALLNRITNAS